MTASDSRPVIIFNPNPRIETLPLESGLVCHVVDDVLLEPERVVDWAAERSEAFQQVNFNAYPGSFLMMPEVDNMALQNFFLQHLRPLFDARRLLDLHCRLSMVALPPEALKPFQRICHSDNFRLEPSQSIQASVLYLFKDVALGGTSFYRPAGSVEATQQLFRDAMLLPDDVFTARYGIQPGYLHGSNEHFTCIGSVPARWNRMIVYDGSILHSGDISAPEKLSTDPRNGRLSFNGFFTCRRNAR